MAAYPGRRTRPSAVLSTGSLVLVAIVVVTALILINALYVAAEFAAVSVRRSRIQQMAADGNALAAWLLPVLQSPASLDRYIAACQIGITLSSLVLGAYAQATFAVWLQPTFASLAGLQDVAAQSTSTVVVLLVLTVGQVIFAELVPKSLALQYPTHTALYTLIPMAGSLWIYRPFIKWLNGTGLLLLRLIGASPQAHRHIHSPDEIELLIAESRDGGLLEPEEQLRLHRALRLGLRTARQLMVPRTDVITVDARAPIRQVVDDVLNVPFSRFPVIDGAIDNVVGLLHVRDVAAAVVAGSADDLAALVRPIAAAPESMPADRLLPLFRSEKAEMALVVDEFGGFAGVVTLSDVLGELLGPVDARDRADDVERMADGRFRVPAQVLIVDLPDVLRQAWPGRADTVAGLVLKAAGRLPLPGDRLDVQGLQVEIERVEDRVPATVLVTPPAPGLFDG